MGNRYATLTLILLLHGLPSALCGQEMVLDFPDHQDSVRDRQLPVKFHLPKSNQPSPLVIVSHGASGTRDGLFALASELAENGYVVLCLEHVTSNLDDIRRRMRNNRVGYRDALVACGKDLVPRKNRPLDVRASIDFATRLNQKDQRLRGRIDFSKIAMLGHSFGAYTTMACCGVKPVGIEEDLSDNRIHLGIALSPQAANGNFFDKDSFANIKVPFVGITGKSDKTSFLTSVRQRGDFFKLMPANIDKHFIFLNDAGHFSFSDPSGSNRKTLLRPDEHTTRVLKTIVPKILDAYLLGQGELKEADRNALVKASLGGSVTSIQWQVSKSQQ